MHDLPVGYCLSLQNWIRQIRIKSQKSFTIQYVQVVDRAFTFAYFLIFKVRSLVTVILGHTHCNICTSTRNVGDPPHRLLWFRWIAGKSKHGRIIDMRIVSIKPFTLMCRLSPIWIGCQRCPPRKEELRGRGPNSISNFYHDINGGAVDNTLRHRQKPCKGNLPMRYLWVE
jgi:hypothetical protein